MSDISRVKIFKDLVVWQKAHAFVLAIYHESLKFPSDERYGLTSQIRRASVSIAANIAEGFRKRHRNDKIKFYSISQTSLEEVRYYLILLHDLGYLDTTNLNENLEDVSRLLEGLIQSIEKSTKYG